MAMTSGGNIEYKPGQTVPQSGIYQVTHTNGTYAPHEVTCIEGKIFPPAKDGSHPRFKLVRAAKHVTDHPNFK